MNYKATINRKLGLALSLSALLAGCQPAAQTQDSTKQQTADSVRLDENVLLYLDALVSLGCRVRIDGAAISDEELAEGVVHAEGDCNAAPINERGGVFVAVDSNLTVTRVKGYYIERQSGLFNGFVVTSDGAVRRQDTATWFQELGSSAGSFGFTAREVDRTSARRSASLASGASTVGAVGGLQTQAGEMCEGACCDCQAEYVTTIETGIQMVPASLTASPAIAATLAAASASAPMDAANHCANCGDKACAAGPRCETAEDCAELVVEEAEFCVEWSTISGPPECVKWAEFDECKMDENAIWSCYSSEVMKFTEEPGNAELATTTCDGLILPSESALPELAPSTTQTANGDECTCGEDDGEMCYEGAQQVCRPSYGEWCTYACCWQRTGLNNCTQPPAPEEVPPMECSRTVADACGGESSACAGDGSGGYTCEGCEAGTYNCNGTGPCESSEACQPACDQPLTPC